MKLRNGEIWLDTDGNEIHAHGGCILKVGDFYYWYGEDRRQNFYVSCYRSCDLTRWEFRRHILTTASPVHPIRMQTTIQLSDNNGNKVNLERPKVLYNKKTNKFILWAHYENGKNYSEAACAVASCDSPDGDFVYHGHFRPLGYMSRDCTLFQKENGDAYLISTARDNADIHIYRLQEDYLNIATLTAQLWPGEYREAPAVFERNGKYYMLTSFCTGWQPNQGKYATSDTIEGMWSTMKDFGDATTYNSQPAFVLPVTRKGHVDFLYFGDRWNAENYNKSGYLILPLAFDIHGKMSLSYCHEFEFAEEEPADE